MNKVKKDKLTLSPDHIKDLNHWRDQWIALDKQYHSKDNDKIKTIKSMLNKYLDNILEYNKKIKEKTQTKV